MKLYKILAATALAGLIAGCTTMGNNPGDSGVVKEQAMKTTITGEVYYRERIALPPGAELSVVLLDASLSNPLANIFAGTNISLDGKNVPVPFSFVVDQSTIPGNTYEVRALIRSKTGDIIWRTNTGHIVDLSSSTYNAGKLKLVMVNTTGEMNSAALQEGPWAIEDINGGGVIDSSNVTVSFSTDGKISGSGGCNYFSGNYEVSGNSLNISGAMAMTRKACAPALMNQDQRLTSILQSAQSYSINDGELTILNKHGRSITARRQ